MICMRSCFTEDSPNSEDERDRPGVTKMSRSCPRLWVSWGPGPGDLSRGIYEWPIAKDYRGGRRCCRKREDQPEIGADGTDGVQANCGSVKPVRPGC